MLGKTPMIKSQLTIIILWTTLVSGLAAAPNGVKHIIFMVPDGMGISNVTAARVHAFGISKERFHFERMRHIGYQSTHSLDSLVTDSAAASSAWACGEKFRNGEVSYHQDSEASPRTILEMARDRGWSTGLVATSTITHATPAAFAAHVADRGCEQEIARQYIMETKVDILLGAGRGMFNSGEEDADPCGTWGNLIPAAAERGYRIVRTREEMLRGEIVAACSDFSALSA